MGSLCRLVKTLIVSLVRPSKGGTRCPIELLWTAKKCKHSTSGLPASSKRSHVFILDSDSGVLDGIVTTITIVIVIVITIIITNIIIIIQEFRVVRRCVRYGVGQEHGQQIL